MNRPKTSAYWSVKGTYQGLKGFYIIAVSLSVPKNLRHPVALSKLNVAVLRTHKGTLEYNTLQEAQEEMLPCIEDIEQQRPDYCDRLSPDVYFFEV